MSDFVCLKADEINSEIGHVFCDGMDAQWRTLHKRSPPTLKHKVHEMLVTLAMAAAADWDRRVLKTTRGLPTLLLKMLTSPFGVACSTRQRVAK